MDYTCSTNRSGCVSNGPIMGQFCGMPDMRFDSLYYVYSGTLLVIPSNHSQHLQHVQVLGCFRRRLLIALLFISTT